MTPREIEFIKKVPGIFCRGESGLPDFGEIFEVVKMNVEDDVDSTRSLDLCARVPQDVLRGWLWLSPQLEGEKTRIGMRCPVP